jgi:hypothetical protein
VKLIGPEGVGFTRKDSDLLPKSIEQRRGHLTTIAGHHPQLCFKGFHRQQLLACERVRGQDDEPVAFRRAHHGQRRSGAATCEFDDPHAWPQRAARFGAFDHGEFHAIFVRAGRIEGFELDDHVGIGRTDDPTKTDDRRVADRLQHRFGN